MQRLLCIAPAPILKSDDGYVLDGKFLTGMALHGDFWDGEMDCILRLGAQSIPFGAQPLPKDPGFGLTVLEEKEPITAQHLDGYDVVLCSVDDAQTLHLPSLTLARPPKFFVTIEYTLKTRLEAAWLDAERPLIKRLYGMLWCARQEKRRKHFMATAEGVQSNGYPGLQTYGHLNDNTLLYFDNRMTEALFCSAQDQAARVQRLNSGAPLQLVYSGRLERMKGANDLVPIAAKLHALGVDFRLDIFGEGSLKEEIARAIEAKGLGAQVTLHAPVDFETELVPYISAKADIYLCCHRQSDPSCTYLENMGCGLAVAGYGNQMWQALSAESGAGWTVPMGDLDAMAALVQRLDGARAEVVACSEKAMAFAKEHDFLTEFRKRMSHLVQNRP
jgi:glycosyltransferase involved in cell wall biosynthesis